MPHMLYWTLPGGFDSYNRPKPDDFITVEERRVFGSGNTRQAEKPFASRRISWLIIGYKNLDFFHNREKGIDYFQWETPHGTLTARRQSSHMTEFPIKTAGDIDLWRYIQENMVYRKNPEFADQQAREHWSVGWPWSPVQEMLQFVTGVENFYYLMTDEPDVMKSLLDVMHRNNLKALNIGFQSCPNATVLRLTENTSSQIISPGFYRDLTLPHVRTYVNMAHRRGMKCVVHMCGCLMALLDCIEETGMDGIHSVTPPPVGDTPYMALRERMGDGFIILGRFSAQLFVNRDKNVILDTLRGLVPERLIHTPFALQASTDEMQPCERDIYALIEALDHFNREYG